MNPLKRACGCPCGGVITTNHKHAILSPSGMNLSMHSSIDNALNLFNRVVIEYLQMLCLMC